MGWFALLSVKESIFCGTFLLEKSRNCLIDFRYKVGYWTFGFGYDHASDDYKVVAMFIPVGSVASKYMVGIYSRKVDSWRRIKDFRDGFVCSCGTFASGKLYWLPGFCICYRNLICLDLASETYGRVELPEFANGPMTIGVLGGSISLLRYVSNTCIDLWSMVEHGLQQTWTKVVSFPHFGIPNEFLSSFQLLFGSENGQTVLKYGSSFVCYDAKQNSHRICKFGDDSVELFLYIESLISPDAGDEGQSKHQMTGAEKL